MLNEIELSISHAERYLILNAILVWDMAMGRSHPELASALPPEDPLFGPVRVVLPAFRKGPEEVDIFDLRQVIGFAKNVGRPWYRGADPGTDQERLSILSVPLDANCRKIARQIAPGLEAILIRINAILYADGDEHERRSMALKW